MDCLRSRICALLVLAAAPSCLFEDPCDGGPSCDNMVEIEVRHLERVDGHTVFVVVDGVEVTCPPIDVGEGSLTCEGFQWVDVWSEKKVGGTQTLVVRVLALPSAVDVVVELDGATKADGHIEPDYEPAEDCGEHCMQASAVIDAR
jgi:hypothetical protein